MSERVLARPTTPLHQVAALPYKSSKKAGLSVLLITSRQTGRWVVPKGNLMPGKAPHEAAAIETEEEAGVRGNVSPISIGSFHYTKLLADGGSVTAEVELFPLAVTKQSSRWIEMHQRRRRWFTVAEAATAVDEVELGELIHRFGEGQGPRPSD